MYNCKNLARENVMAENVDKKNLNIIQLLKPIFRNYEWKCTFLQRIEKKMVKIARNKNFNFISTIRLREVGKFVLKLTLRDRRLSAILNNRPLHLSFVFWHEAKRADRH